MIKNQNKVSTNTGTKFCTSCNVAKDRSFFNRNSRRPDGLQSFCKDCQRSQSKSYYGKRSAEMITMINNKRKERREIARLWIANYLSSHPCVDCAEDDIRVLDFDHLREKYKDISRMIKDGSSIESIASEVAKCVVRCSVCHRIVTSERSNDWRNQFIKVHK